MNTQRLAWYLVRVYEYDCPEANEPVFTLKDIQAEFKVKYPKVMHELRVMHHLLQLSFVPYKIREVLPSRGKKKTRKTRVVDVLFMPKLPENCIITFTDKKGYIQTVTASAKYGDSFLYRKKNGNTYRTVEIPCSSIIDITFEE